MAKTGYYRFEIYWADLSKLNLDNHFVIIVSNFKQNNKGLSLNCCLITSKLRGLSSRVDINLLKACQVACETILTVNKSDLLYKQCDISDIFTQLEIEKCLESQLQLSNNYINNIDIETCLSEGVQRVDNESNLVNLRNNICNLALENKFQESIILCNKLIDMANASSLNCKAQYLWHSYYHRSLMYSKLGHHELSLEDARESLKFTGSLRNGLTPKYSYSMWLIAKNLENLNDISGAIRIYTSLNVYSKKIGKLNMRVEMSFNIARLNKNVSRMKNLIRLIQKIDYRELESNKNKSELLNQMEEDLKAILQ